MENRKMKTSKKKLLKKPVQQKKQQIPQRMTIQQAKKLGLLKNLGKKQSRSKYNNRRTLYKDRWYDSAKEAERACELDLLLKDGLVTEVIPQFKLEIKHNDVKICSYFADFRVTYENGKIEYEDVKGVRTDVYKLKKKLVKAFHNIDIKEV